MIKFIIRYKNNKEIPNFMVWLEKKAKTVEHKKISPQAKGSWGGCGLYQVTDEKINCA